MMNILLKSRLPIFMLGAACFIIGERYLSHESFHLYIRIVAFVLMAVAAIIPLVAAKMAKKQGNTNEMRCWRMLSFWKFGAIAGFAVYMFYAMKMGNSATPNSFPEKALLATWLMLLIFSFFGGAGLEVSHAHSGLGNSAEPNRIRRSGMSWKMVGMLLVILMSFNYVAAKKDKAFDWSYLKATTPSSSTLAMFGALDEKIEIAVFYPHDNEVRSFVAEYFDYLAANEARINLNYYDKDMHPSKSEEFKASKNGQIIFRKGKKRERIDVGLKLKSARKTLSKMDAEIQKVFYRLTEEKKKIYFTRGHGELTWVGKKEGLQSLDLLENFLRAQNYNLRLLGLGDGSANEIPDDASMVVIAGPKSPFMDHEANALWDYLNKGGKLAVFLDNEKQIDGVSAAGTGQDPLLAMLEKAGITYSKKMLANDKKYVTATRSPVDKWFLYSRTFSTHESVVTLAKHDERVAVMAYQMGSFEIDAKKNGWKGYTTVRSDRDTFVDENRNYAFDKGKETRKTYTVGIAAQKEVSVKQEDGSEKEQTAKIFAFADANVISDVLIRNRGNAVYLLDSLKWLAGKSKFAGEVSSEEDVKIRHSNKEDAIWFNATVIVMPLFVLLAGFFATRRRKKKGV